MPEIRNGGWAKIGVPAFMLILGLGLGQFFPILRSTTISEQRVIDLTTQLAKLESAIGTLNESIKGLDLRVGHGASERAVLTAKLEALSKQLDRLERKVD